MVSCLVISQHGISIIKDFDKWASHHTVINAVLLQFSKLPNHARLGDSDTVGFIICYHVYLVFYCIYSIL